jgi:predicted DNA-binding transcriptional regulator YafY
MRADRLVAALLLLQARGRVTAAVLAAELEVSVATARRDLEALSAAGIPVYPQAGRNGGWQLLGGARTDLSGLTAAESQALFLLLGPAAGQRIEQQALRKLVRALPHPFRADAEAAADAVMVDPAGWGELDPDRPAMVATLQGATVGRRRIELVYESRHGRSTRSVDPLGLVDKDDVWYLVAATPQGQRTFRVDRIVEATVTDETFERPEGFTLAAAWERVVADMEQRRAQTAATATIPTRFVGILQDQLGRHCEAIQETGERTRVRVTAPTPRDIARNLAGWGDLVDVEEPATVQEELARIGAELTGRYRISARRPG